MAYTLKDPTTHANEIIRVRNDRTVLQTLAGNIEGNAAFSEQMTPGTTVTLHSDGTTWWIVSYSVEPLFASVVAPVLPLPIGVTETNTGISVTLPIRGIWIVTGSLNFEHTIGNNQTVAGELIARRQDNSQQVGATIPWGFGRLSTFADIVVPIAAQLDNRDDSVTGIVLELFAVNTGDGTLDLNTPAELEYSGPY